jgi:hypothetical protein
MVFHQESIRTYWIEPAMNWLFGDPKAPVYIVLVAVLAAMVLAFLFVSWRDTVRAMREFFTLPKRGRRPRFSLRTLLWVTAGLAIVLKAGSFFAWWPAWGWFDKVLFVVLIFAGFLLLCTLVQSYLSTYDRRPDVHTVTRIGPPGEDQPAETDSKEKRGHVRPEVKKRRVSPFRW